MSDLVVTVPKDIWFEWIEEGDAVGLLDHLYVVTKDYILLLIICYADMLQ